MHALKTGEAGKTHGEPGTMGASMNGPSPMNIQFRPLNPAAPMPTGTRRDNCSIC